MIKSLKQFLGKMGSQIVRTLKKYVTQRPQVSPIIQNDNYTEKIACDPLNAQLHLKYAISAFENHMPFLAYAELKTAEFLGADRAKIKKYKTEFRSAIPNLIDMNHNQYFRFKSISTEILNRGIKMDFSLADIGGGQGELAAFFSDDIKYCLVEPSVNGISGINMPFPDHSFDYVVSCHVLEHIPVENRNLFLDQLLSKSRYGIFLLNPFYLEGTSVDERLKLFIDITGAPWAKEHLKCTLPKLDYIKAYTSDRGLQFYIKPNGTLTTSMAFVFVDYFAAKSGHFDQWKKVNAFFNQNYIPILDSEAYPNSYLIYIGQ